MELADLKANMDSLILRIGLLKLWKGLKAPNWPLGVWARTKRKRQIKSSASFLPLKKWHLIILSMPLHRYTKSKLN